MIKEKINIYDNSLTLSEGFTAFLNKLLTVYPRVHLCLSGGSTPKALFDYWAENCQDSIEWEKISFYWGDERCVPSHDIMSNYGMTKRCLFDKIPRIAPMHIHHIHGENHPLNEADTYNEIIGTAPLQNHQIPCFEVIMLGLGEDGHTASIFPDQIEQWDNEENCIITKHPESSLKRISITGKVINNAQHVAFLVTGKNKSEKVRDIITNRNLFHDKYPGARVLPKYGYLHWFLDKEAASLLPG